MSEEAGAPELTGEDGWTAIDRFSGAGTLESYVSGDPRGRRLRVRYFRREADSALMARVWFGPGTQGPPGHVHGGALAALLDEAMGFAAWMVGRKVVAVRLETDFRRMVRLGAVGTLEAWIAGVEERKVLTRGRLLGPDGEVAVEAAGTFLELAPDHLQELAGHAVAAGIDPAAFERG